MNTAYVYLQLYKLFDDVTPFKADCGSICGERCCKGDDSGMLLFPGEKEVYKLLNPDWARIEKTDFTYEYDGRTRSVPILFCSGECDRFQRPLACRIFPLAPYLDGGKIRIIIDPRGKGICPLARSLRTEDFDSKFLENTEKAFRLLAKNKRFMAFMDEYSKYIDEFGRFFD